MLVLLILISPLRRRDYACADGLAAPPLLADSCRRSEGAFGVITEVGQQ